MPEIAFIMGKSASGKDKIFHRMVEDEELDLQTVVTYTTRPMRVGEMEGVEYHFVSDEEAMQMKADNRVVEMREYNTVHGLWRYFTADDGQIKLHTQMKRENASDAGGCEPEEITKSESTDGNGKYIVIGTLEAYEKFCEYYGKEHILPIYIEVDDGIRLSRALKREMKQEVPRYEEMCRRFLADAEDFKEDNLRKAGIVKRFTNNGELDDCIMQVRSEILANIVGI